MERFPELLQSICETYEVHHLTYYLTELASQFHRYFNLGTKIADNRIVTTDVTLTQARLALIEAIRMVIFIGLDLLGVEAPEKM